MQFDRLSDQAEGLRRLLVRSSTHVVTVVAARMGMGTSSVVVNLAAALARTGKNVLVLDENLSHDNVSNMLALKPRFELLHAIRRDKSLREVMLLSPQKIRVLPAARAIQSLPVLSAPERDSLLECLAEASRGVDVVLVDAAAGREYHISASLAPNQPLMIVLNSSASAIMESYAMIKRMALHEGRQNFEIVVNKARDEQEAHNVFANLSQVARLHLRVGMEYLGYIPLDEKLKRATQLCCPVQEAFPEAQAVKAFDELGRNLMLLPAVGNGEAGGLPDVVQRMLRRQQAPSPTAYAINP